MWSLAFGVYAELLPGSCTLRVLLYGDRRSRHASHQVYHHTQKNENVTIVTAEIALCIHSSEYTLFVHDHRSESSERHDQCYG